LLFRIPDLRSLLATVIIAGLTSACSVSPSKPLLDPQVSVHAISIENISLAGIEGVLGLEVKNPNARRIVATGYDFQVDVAGIRFLSGEHDGIIHIPGEAVEKIEVPVGFTFVTLAGVLPHALEKRRLDYVAHGTVHVGLRHIPFEKAGLLQLPAISIQ
jgi:LEA14-like dessication related protein